jgi:cytochrome c peroxidase
MLIRIILCTMLLLSFAVAADVVPPLGLPPIPWPKENPYTKEKATLGQLLFFDKRLSYDQTVSCASCHNKQCGFSDCKAIAVGIDHTLGTRHSPSIINSAFLTSLFWDGRAHSLEEQCQGPLANPKEMAGIKDPHEALHHCTEQVQKIPEYKPLFKEAFGSDEITLDKISKAISTFERTILSGNSAYDRYIAGDRSALTEEQIHGLALFKKTGCINCHIEPLFSDNRFHNIGVGMDNANPDLGRYTVTHDEKDWGAFKTPMLRDVSKSGPYMHNGSLATLEDVINYYNDGGTKNKNLHPLMRPLNLSEADKKALMSFLQALDGN